MSSIASLCYDSGMSFTDYMWIKLIVLGTLAAGIGFYAGFTGRSIEEVLHGRKGQAGRQSAPEQTKGQRQQGD